MHTAKEALDILNEDLDASDLEREMHDQDTDASCTNNTIPLQPIRDSDSSLSDEERQATQSVHQDEQNNNVLTWTPLLAARVKAPIAANIFRITASVPLLYTEEQVLALTNVESSLLIITC